jgi:radical SAM superfamily enzyme YgiQ (UPF0313 family)
MSRSIYLVNPRADFPTYFGAEMMAAWGLRPVTTIADLATTTVAAMVPDDFEIRICDEHVTPVDFGTPADFVALTAKISQGERMRAIAREFRRRDKMVLIGGPLASLSPEVVGPDCDVLVRGEVEEIAGELFSDLRSGRWKEEYAGTRPSLDLTPPPRWDLYPNERAVLGAVQTSRGCPFDCEFCDVIPYLGRRQRLKPIAHVLGELDALYRHGYRSVFLADDNFTASRRRAKELLVALREWNERREDGKLTFSTQVSIDAARDDELLRLCAEAGLIQVFVGIETPNEESLREAGKRQNLGVDLAAQVQKFYDYGIAVVGGIIVGFDHDDRDIFARQYELATAAALPTVTLGALVAPAATRLHDRLEAEGRLVAHGSEMAAMPWSTNVIPRRMTREELLAGIRWLANQLYRPAAFADRLLRFIERVGERRDPKFKSSEVSLWKTRRAIEREARVLMRKIAGLGWAETKLALTILGVVVRKPHVLDLITPAVLQYTQIRYMYDQGRLWEPRLASQAHPFD